MGGIDFVWPPAWSVAAFLLLMAALIPIWLVLARQGRRVDERAWHPAALGLILGLLGALNLVVAGFWPWPQAFALGAALVILSGLLPMLWLGLSRRSGGIALAAPLWLLVGAQGFRLPLELLLHVWVEAGSIPRTMTWSGQNPDISSGIVALVAAPLLWLWPRQRWIAWSATIIGLLLLANVLRVVLLSAPLPFWEQRVEPPLVLVAKPPLSLIGPWAVGSALAWHLLALRALGRRAEAPDQP